MLHGICKNIYVVQKSADVQYILNTSEISILLTADDSQFVVTMGFCKNALEEGYKMCVLLHNWKPPNYVLALKNVCLAL